METNEDYTQARAFVDEFDKTISQLLPYVPYFTEKGGQDVSSDYDGKLGESKIKFPVYDQTLMNFIKLVQKTNLMDRNYVYAYTKRRIKTFAQEEKYIETATIRDTDYLKGVISKYVSEGMRKTGVWQDAVERKLFLKVILKFKELLDFNKRY